MIAPHRIVLDDALVRHPLNVAGHTIVARRASSATAEITIFTEESSHVGFPISRGEGFEHKSFDRLLITAAAQPNQWIDLLIDGRPQDADSRFARNIQGTTIQTVEIGSSIEVPTFERFIDASDSAKEFVEIGINTSSASYVNLYTVPVGKTLKLRGLYAHLPALTVNGNIRIVDGSVVEQHVWLVKMVSGIFPIGPLSIPAGWALQVKSDGAANINVSGDGWVE